LEVIMGSTIQGISRPYVGQNARSIDDVKQVTDKKPGDVTSPATPQLIRAWAFELTADGSSAVPPPPPNTPGRDPLVIELGQLEIGTRVELISLSDNPQAEFTSTCKSDIFELPLTGYDVGNRRGTIALNEDQMKEKGIAPGERFMLRQVDKDGNASEAIHVHLDPAGWANTTINEPTQGGGSQQVRGRQIDVAVGLLNLQGNATPGTIERVLGKSTTDTSAPKLVDSAVSISTEKLTRKEHETVKAYVAAMGTLIGGSNYEPAYIEQTLTANASWAQNPSYAPHYAVLKDLVADQSTWARLAAFAGQLAGNPNKTYIDWNGANAIAQKPEAPSLTVVKLNKALEPGVTVNIQNSRTGEVVSQLQGDQARAVSLLLQDVKHGDPIIMTYADRAGNAGSPYAFSFDETARDGKAKSNPLDIRLGGFGLKPKPTTPIV
jgi:hypothetical protein